MGDCGPARGEPQPSSCWGVVNVGWRSYRLPRKRVRRFALFFVRSIWSARSNPKTYDIRSFLSTVIER